MRNRGLFALASFIFALCACRTANDPTPNDVPSTASTPIPNTLYVDATAQLGSISPLVYGTNYGPWSSVSLGVMDAYQASNLRHLRFPGGFWGDTNYIRNTQLDQLMLLAEMIDAETSVSVRLLDGTPEKAAELIEYANLTKDYGITYWSIGNEPTLYASSRGATEWDTAYYNERWRLFADAMKAVDPEIQLIGPDIHQFSAVESQRPKDDQGRDWMHEFLVANGDMVDIVSIHRYAFPRSASDPLPSIEDLRQNSREWDAIIPALREEIRETTGRDIPVAVTEVNSNWTGAAGGEATPDSFYNAIWWADVLGRLIRQQVDIVDHFALQHKTSGWGLLTNYDIRPTYYVHQMYRHFGDELLYASSDDPDVSILAALRDDGALTLMLINLAPETISKPLRLDGIADEKTADVWLFDIDHQAEPVGDQKINSDSTVSLPPQSISLFIIP